MDEMVLRGLAKWPNVPAVFGWLSLDRRGKWLIQGDHIDNPVVASYIGRNYECDASGRWFFQNGPQRVYVTLAYTPLIYRVLDARENPPIIEAHTGVRSTALSGVWIDEEGTVILQTELGVGLVHDHDVAEISALFVGADGLPASESALEQGMEQLQQRGNAPLWLKAGDANVKVNPVVSTELPRLFGFNPQPAADQET